MARRQRPREPRQKLDRLYEQLRIRYGERCCYCNGLMCFIVTKNSCNKPYIRSLEHIKDFNTIKGIRQNPDHIDNLLLAHRHCNSVAGGHEFTLEQKEFYIENPQEFIRRYLNGKQIRFNRD